MNKINDCLLKLKAVGLDINSYNFPKNQRSVDGDLWPGIGFPDIYMDLMSTPGKTHKAEPKGIKRALILIHTLN